MTLLGISLNGENVEIVTSVCAVIISTFAFIASIIFGFSQRKHNRNSVRPISAIKVKDYENYLSVSIQNVGTGPLTISRLWMKEENSDHEYSTLIEMMPYIQRWRTFVERSDGWTIAVGTQLELLGLEPQNDEDKTAVRKKLSGITVYLNYTDIYGTKYHDERKLTFFGRTLQIVHDRNNR